MIYPAVKVAVHDKYFLGLFERLTLLADRLLAVLAPRSIICDQVAMNVPWRFFEYEFKRKDLNIEFLWLDVTFPGGCLAVQLSVSKVKFNCLSES